MRGEQKAELGTSVVVSSLALARYMRILIALSLGLAVGCTATENRKPPQGVVPDETTAKLIAEAVWKPIYGAKCIDGQKPFRAWLEGRVWHVWGTPPKPQEEGAVMLGGTAKLRIDRFSGKILRLSHSE